MAEGRRWDILVCDHCGQNAEENWRCRHGLCDRTADGEAVEPSESLVEVMPVEEHEAALAKARTEGRAEVRERLRLELKGLINAEVERGFGHRAGSTSRTRHALRTKGIEAALSALDSLTKEES